MPRRSVLAFALAMPIAGTWISPALADKDRIYAPGGVAIAGYDAVAYFTEGRAVPGSDAHMLMWRGAMWAFSSADNMEAFEMNPSAYAPQFGGYCAFAVSQGERSPADPEIFSILDGHLYLNNSQSMRKAWEAGPATMVARAHANWPALSGQ